jgi:hypothetical protein
MKIVLHILLKDLRRHWREITLYVAVVAGWAWQEVHPDNLLWRNQRDVLPVLLFVLWFFITVRTVQGESLIGDREFWQTRPYRWGQLLAAKVLFLAVCLNLPLLLAEVYLLHAAGLAVTPSLIPELLFLQLKIAFFFTFPAAVLASITESIVQWVLVIIGILLACYVMTWLPWGLLPATFPGAERTGTLLGLSVVGSMLAFALIWQYTQRGVWAARWVAAAAVVAIPALVVFTAGSWVRSIGYPRLSGQAVPLHLAIAESGPNKERQYVRTYSGSSPIVIPVNISSIAPGTFVDIEAARFSIDGDNGWHWQSPWSREEAHLDATDSGTYLSFYMAGDQADQLANNHGRVTAELLLAIYRVSPPQRVSTSVQHFNFPGSGVCNWDIMDLGNTSYNGLNCVASLRLPDLILTRVESGENTCRTPEGELPSGHSATGIDWSSRSVFDQLDPNPVQTINLDAGIWSPAIQSKVSKGEDVSARICPGTPITVRTGTFTQSVTITVDLGSIGAEKPEERKDEPADDSE